jgi:hypothetical protein
MALESLNRINIQHLNVESPETAKSIDVAEQLVKEHESEILDHISSVDQGDSFNWLNFATNAHRLKVASPEVFDKIGIGDYDEEQIDNLFYTANSDQARLQVAMAIKIMYPDKQLQFPDTFAENVGRKIAYEIDQGSSGFNVAVNMARNWKILFSNLDIIGPEYKEILRSNLLQELKSAPKLFRKIALSVALRTLFPEEKFTPSLSPSQLENHLKEYSEPGRWDDFIREAYTTKLYLAEDIKITDKGLQLSFDKGLPNPPDLTVPEQRIF